MDKRKLTKTIVNNLTGIGVGTVTTNVTRSYVPRSDNKIIDAILGASIFVTSWTVGSTVLEPVTTHSDKLIDGWFDAFAEVKN